MTDPIRLTCPDLPAPHGFFTRQGGVSLGPYASLNCSLSSADDPAAVRENRARASRALGTDADNLVGLTQVHGIEVVVVEDPWPAGSGPRADALVCQTRGLALGIVTADCAPVLFADASAGVIGAAHAGWRGAVAGVLEATVVAMIGLGADPARIIAAIGPCIGQDSYEVGTDLHAAVLAVGAEGEAFLRPGRQGHWQFDLPGYCAARLAHAGISAWRAVAADTCAEPDRFFSHRRRTLAGGGPIGHQISIVAG